MKWMFSLCFVALAGCGLAGAESHSGFQGGGGASSGASKGGSSPSGGGFGGTPDATASGAGGAGGSTSSMGGAGTAGATTTGATTTGATTTGATASSSSGPLTCSNPCGICKECDNGACKSLAPGSTSNECQLNTGCNFQGACACDGSGNCKRGNGQFCGSDSDCVSGACVGQCRDHNANSCHSDGDCNVYPGDSCAAMSCQ